MLQAAASNRTEETKFDNYLENILATSKNQYMEPNGIRSRPYIYITGMEEN